MTRPLLTADFILQQMFESMTNKHPILAIQDEVHAKFLALIAKDPDLKRDQFPATLASLSIVMNETYLQSALGNLYDAVPRFWPHEIFNVKTISVTSPLKRLEIINPNILDGLVYICFMPIQGHHNRYFLVFSTIASAYGSDEPRVQRIKWAYEIETDD